MSGDSPKQKHYWDLITQQLPACCDLQDFIAWPSASALDGLLHAEPQACPSAEPVFGFEVANALWLGLCSQSVYSFLQFLFQNCTPCAREGAAGSAIEGTVNVKANKNFEKYKRQFTVSIV